MLYYAVGCWLLLLACGSCCWTWTRMRDAACGLYQRACSDRDCGCIMHIQFRHRLPYNIQTDIKIKIHNNNTNLRSSLLTLILRFTHGHYETKLSPRTQESRYANKIAKTKRARLKNPESKLSSRNFFRKWEISQWKKSQIKKFSKNYFQKLNFIQETYLTFYLNVYSKKVRAYYNKKVESAWCG